MDSARNKLLLLFLLYISSVIALTPWQLKKLKAEEMCDKLTERPFFNHDFIMGSWRAYYTWGKMIRRCESIKIKAIGDTIRKSFAHAVKDFLEVDPDWSDAELLVVLAKEKDELLMFPQGNVSGRFRALINNHQTVERFAARAGKSFQSAPNWDDAELMLVIGNGTGLARTELLLLAEKTVRGRYKALINPRALGLFTSHYGINYMKLAFKGYNFFKYLVLINCSSLIGWLMARPNDTTVTIKEVMAVVDRTKLPLEGKFSCLP